MKRRVDRSAHMDGRVGQTPHPRGAGSVGAGAHGGGLGRRWRRIGLPIPSDGRAAGTAWRRRRRHGIVLLLLILGLVGAAPFSATPAAADSTTAFTPVYPANTCPPPSYVVPAGVYLLRVVASGGAGQAGQDYNGLTSLDTHFGGRGGHGARVSAVLKVTPGETLYVDVAHSGNGNDSDTGHPNGGYAYDVTNGLQYIMNNGNAGGSSIVETNSSGNPCSFSRGDYLVVAGGGGGGGGTDGFGGGGAAGAAGAAADGSGQNGGNGGGSSCEYGNSGGGGTATGAGGAGAGGCGGGGRGLNGVAGDGSQGGIAGGQAASEADNGAGGAGGGGNGSGGAGSSAVGPGVILESIAATTLPPMVVFAPIYSPPDSLYTVAAGNNFTCTLTAGQTVSCWGDNSAGEATPPAGTFTSLSAGGRVVCGIRTDHTIACWGDNTYNQTLAPSGQFHQVSVGGNFVCGLRVDSTIACWGAGAQNFYQSGLYTAISSGSNYYCALTYDQHPACQGNTAQVPSTTPAGDQFTQISSGLYAPCGIRTDGTSVCWGGSLAPTPIPAGTFSGLSSASYSGNMCWIGTDGTLQCATSPYGTFLPAPPTGAFSAVSMGYAHSCGVPATGGVVCWGDNSKGETTPLITGAFPNPNSSVPPPATPSQPYSFTFGTTYESPAATFSLTGGSLPPGLTLSPSGVLAGTPTAVGDYNFTISAGNGVAPVATLTTHLLVTQAPAFTSANSATFVAGSAGSFVVTTTGEPAAALSESGALPGGVTFTDNGDGTASLGGTPAAHSGGVYALTITARNGVSPDASQAFTLTVNEAPSFTSPNSAPFGLNTTNAFTVTAQGYPTPTLSESGALPAGVTFDAASGRLSGTPSGSGGAYTLTFTAHNGVGTDASQTFTLTTVPWVARAPLPDGREYLATATGTDGTLYAIGGYDASANPRSAVYALSPGASSWRAVAPLPLGFGDGRAYAAAATGLDGTIYLIGGVDHFLSAQSSVYAYTPATNSWSQMASLPGARAELAATTGADGTIYALGGWSGQIGSSSNREQPYNTVFAYHAATNTWSQVSALPTSDRSGLAATTGADGTIYAIGGYGNTYYAQSSVFAYTPATDSWRSLASLPGARVDLAAATGAGGAIYAIGGADASNTAQSSVYAYTPATDSWAPLPNLPGGFRGLGAGGGADGAIYAIGGQGDSGAAQTTLAYYPPPIPPTISSANSATFAVGTPGTFTVTATGRPVPALSESGALPAGVTFTDNGDGTASLSGTPARGAGGSYPLTLTAHNGGLPDATQSFTLTVTNPLPATSGISPAAVQAGGGAVALTVSGAHFVPGSRVRVTAAGRASATLIPSTVVPDGTQLTVTIPSSAITTAGVLQVAVLNAAPGGGASTLQPLFVTAAHAAVASESVSASGTATTGGAGPNTTGSVTVGGSGGSGTVAVAIYAANPGGTPSFAASGGYFDAYVAPGSAFSSVRIVDCALQGGSQAYWYNAATASWIAASTQSYDPATQCTTITVNASSTPSLMQLGGTPFGIANVPPVVAVPGPQNAPYGRTLSFTVTASDIEPDDRVTLTASGLPAGLSIGPTTFNQATGQWTATVSGTVSALPGSYTASITANDGYSTSAAQTVPVTVKLFATGSLLALSQDGASCHLLLNGGATVSAAGTATVNGTSGSALCLNSATFSASTITVQGGVRNNNSTVQGTLLTRQPATADLLSTLPAPTAPAAACPGAACPDGTTLNSGRTYRLLPGAYTAAVTANSGATVCVAPGVYVLNASWTLNSAALRPYGSAGCPAAPSGTSDPGVLLYFAQGHAQVNGSGDFSRLRAMVSGPYAGLLYWQADSESTYLNGSVGFAGGAWYEPKGALTLNGGTRLTAPYVAAAKITVNGGTALTVTGS